MSRHSLTLQTHPADFTHNTLTPPPSHHTTTPTNQTHQAMSVPFTPGADRLAALRTHPSPVSQTPVLDTSNAILDCVVVSACTVWQR